uniref:Signal recognition particle receptor subunit beta-like n=1 Tax=Rhizophora mucronata TaxID=61149 RepID=A0A2P2JYH1_RHIMU
MKCNMNNLLVQKLGSLVFVGQRKNLHFLLRKQLLSVKACIYDPFCQRRASVERCTPSALYMLGCTSYLIICHTLLAINQAHIASRANTS